MLSALNHKREKNKGAGGTFGGDEYTYGIDGDDGFIGIYMCQNIKLYTINTCNLLLWWLI